MSQLQRYLYYIKLHNNSIYTHSIPVNIKWGIEVQSCRKKGHLPQSFFPFRKMSCSLPLLVPFPPIKLHVCYVCSMMLQAKAFFCPQSRWSGPQKPEKKAKNHWCKVTHSVNTVPYVSVSNLYYFFSFSSSPPFSSGHGERKSGLQARVRRIATTQPESCSSFMFFPQLSWCPKILWLFEGKTKVFYHFLEWIQTSLPSSPLSPPNWASLPFLLCIVTKFIIILL